MTNTFLRLSVMFALIGVSLGYWMGMTHQFTLAPVHAHLNLLGWVSMFLYGLFYRVMPDAARGLLPKLHLALAVTGLTIMMIGLTFMLTAVPSLQPYVPPMMIVGPTMVLLGMIVFAFIVVRATAGRPAAEPQAVSQ